MTDQHKDDAMLKQYLEGNSELSKEYNEQEKHQPSTELDKLIIAAAHDATNNNAKKSRRGRNTWIIPTSIAATLVLSFSLIQLQKPDVMFKAEKEMDIASLKSKPQKQLLEKKKERRVKQDFKAVAPLEEQLADNEALVSAPAPATAVMGMAMKSSPEVARRRAEVPQPDAIADTRIILSKSQWLEKIKELLKDKKIDEARKEFELFVKAYPDFVPDTDLEQQLGLEQ